MDKNIMLEAVKHCYGSDNLCHDCPLVDRLNCTKELSSALLDELSNPTQQSCNPDMCMYTQELRDDVERITAEMDKLKEYIKQAGVRYA